MAIVDYPIRRRLYLLLVNQLRLPRRLATAIVKGLTHALDPHPAARRRKAAERLLATGGEGLAIPEQAGYRLLRPEDLPGIPALLGACGRIFAAARASGTLDRRTEDASKRFLVPVCDTESALLAEPTIRELVLSAPVLATAAGYFGRMPILSELQLLWTPANDTHRQSQKYHLDAEDHRQLKLFVNIFEVTPECGPLTLLPADRSAAVCRATGYVGGRRKRLDDEAIARAGAAQDAVRVLGPAGSGVFVDTSRCLHYGSRGNRGERLVLLIQFMDYYAPKLEPTDWAPVTISLVGDLDEASRLLLRC